MTTDPFLTQNLKGLLQEKLWLLEERLQEKRRATAYKGLTPAESRILGTLRGEELTIAELARRLEVSRQAVHKIVSKLVGKKLIKLQCIEGNDRDKKIIFTAAGEAMKKQAGIMLHELENEVETAIGNKNLQRLKILLAKEW